MKIVIIGCGRVGAFLAESYDRAGHQVIVLDVATRAFRRLADSFKGTAVRGDGTDEDTLRRAGGEDADVFLALTEGDNRNVMAAQLAAKTLGAKQVIAKINDPVRAAAYADLGLTTMCRTTLLADAISAHLGLPTSGQAGINAGRGARTEGGAAPTASVAGAAGAGQQSQEA